MLSGFVFGDSLFNSAPLMDFLESYFGKVPQDQKNSKLALNIGIANLMNGTFVSFNEKFKTRDLLKAMKASVSYPVIFEPTEAWNSSWVAGSQIWALDAAAPILRCRALGFADKDIVLDAVIDNANDLSDVDAG